MRVKNRKCIRRLSFKSLWASRKRNIIAICAIALTTLMFTSLFTIMLSVNSSYETYNFRQAGGYSDGIFKDLSREQTDKIAAHKGIKASGERIVCGFSSSDVFGKVAAEVSYMDKNCTKWSYATPTTGKEPQKENEIAMDTTALRLLGVEPKLGTNVTITYQAGNGTDTGIPQTDSFILVGYWEYDDLMPVHYINVSKAYVDKINEKCIAAGDEALDIDLNVMLPSKLNIREQMEKIDTDLGYDWNTRDQENSARIGVNWGLTASSVSSDIDFSLVAAILAFFLLIIFTGYLIIYNIFQISVTGDIRFYVAVSTDDYGNIVNLDNYPELGDTYTVNYQIGYDIDSRTGERADQQTTPEEYLEYHEEEAKEVEYSVCALVTVPDSISFRYTSLGYSMVLPVEKLKEDSGTDVIPKFYMFDTPDSQAEASTEQYLQKLTAGDTSTLMYESKASIRREFTRFKNMFLICGGALCAIIGLVGILNFFNAIMTGILSRKREFAVLQSVGMTKRQLKLMLIYEGLFYAVGSIIASLILSVVLSPMLGNMMSAMFWFVTYHFTIMPVILIIPVFLLLGWLIPAVLYHAGKRQSIVENLREL